MVTESKAAEEYEITELDLSGLVGKSKDEVESWIKDKGIPECIDELHVDIKATFERAAKAGIVKPYLSTSLNSLALFGADGVEIQANNSSAYIVDYTIDDLGGAYSVCFDILKYEPNSSPQVSLAVISIEFSSGKAVWDPLSDLELQGVEYYLFKVKSGSTASVSSSSTPAVRSNHQHAYEWKILTDPTIDEDGVYAYICSCGDIKEKQPISAAQVFVKDLYGKIKEAPQNGTVTYDAKSWSTISDYLLKKMAERNDVTVTIRFQYQKAEYEITFPAGTDYTAVLNDTKTMYGFFGIARILGLEVKAL